MSIKAEVMQNLQKTFGSVTPVAGEKSIYKIGINQVNVRTANKKNGDKYWFDVTPHFYEQGEVDYFIYACGSASHTYVLPRNSFQDFIKGASLGGQKQVPNFTIYSDVHRFEPAGLSYIKHDISNFLNALALISPHQKQK